MLLSLVGIFNILNLEFRLISYILVYRRTKISSLKYN